MIRKILKFANIISLILILINWLALHDIAKKAENLRGEWSFVTITNLIIIVILIANIIFLSWKKKEKLPEEK